MRKKFQSLLTKVLRLPSRPSATIAKINLKPPLKVVEIGVSKGANAFDMLYHMDIEKIYLVDPYRYEEQIQDQHRIEGDLEEYKAHAKKKLERWKDKTVFIYEPFSSKMIPEKVDFVYIDGDHSTKAVLNDIINAFMITRIGGIVGGHDIQYASVRRAVNLLFGKNYNRVGLDWWVFVTRYELGIIFE